MACPNSYTRTELLGTPLDLSRANNPCTAPGCALTLGQHPPAASPASAVAAPAPAAVDQQLIEAAISKGVAAGVKHALEAVPSTLVESNLRARESHLVLVRVWNSSHHTALGSASAASASSSSPSAATPPMPTPASLRVTSYADLLDKVATAFFSSSAPPAGVGTIGDPSGAALAHQLAQCTLEAPNAGLSAPAASASLPAPAFRLYYLTDADRWWESRVKVDSEASFELYVSRPLYLRPMLLLWHPASDCLDVAHQKLAAERHQHSPLKDGVPPSALPSLLPSPVAAALLSPSKSNTSSRSSAQQTDFAEAVRCRDDDRCVVCAAPQVEAAHIVPVKDARTAAGKATAQLLSLYDPRNGLTLCTLCHDFFDAGLWCVSIEDRATVVVSEALMTHRPVWRERQGKQLRLPSHHEDHWPSARTLQVQMDFFHACKLKRVHERRHYPHSCGSCGSRFMTRSGLLHHGRYCSGRGQLKPSQFHTPGQLGNSSRSRRRRPSARPAALSEGSPAGAALMSAFAAVAEEQEEAKPKLPTVAVAAAAKDASSSRALRSSTRR